MTMHVFNMEYLDMFNNVVKLLQNELDTQSWVDLHDLFLTCLTLYIYFPLNKLIYMYVQVLVVIFVVIWSEKWIAVDLKRHFFQVVPYL